MLNYVRFNYVYRRGSEQMFNHFFVLFVGVDTSLLSEDPRMSPSTPLHLQQSSSSPLPQKQTPSPSSPQHSMPQSPFPQSSPPSAPLGSSLPPSPLPTEGDFEEASSSSFSCPKTPLTPSRSNCSPHPSTSPLRNRILETEPLAHPEGPVLETGEKEEPDNTIIAAQLQSQLESSATELAKDEHQSLTEKSKEATENLQVREGVDDEEGENEEDASQEDQLVLVGKEEESLSPVLDMDSTFDKEVMDLMTSSSPPPSLLNLSPNSSPPFSRREKSRPLRATPPWSSRPVDDLSIRLRQSPFSTEASPETSPNRVPVTPPPLSPPSPPSSRESPNLKVTQTIILFRFDFFLSVIFLLCYILF